MSDVLNFSIPSGEGQLNFGVEEGVNVRSFIAVKKVDLDQYSLIYIQALRLYSADGNNIKYLKFNLVSEDGKTIVKKNSSQAFSYEYEKYISLLFNGKEYNGTYNLVIEIVVDLGDQINPSLKNIKDIKLYLGK